MIDHLVINGCSYMHMYAAGRGHFDLAQRLQIGNSQSLAVSGSANTRILRTTMKHSHEAPPTLYVLGMTFVSRWEIPIANPLNDFEGRWCNFQNQDVSHRWQSEWTQKDSDQLIELKLKSEIYSVLDRVEDLMYRIIAVIESLHSRGHRVLVFQTADDLHISYMDSPRLKWFNRPEIVQGFRWRSVSWQNDKGVTPVSYAPSVHHVPRNIQHPAPGQHHVLNEYLTDYIQQHDILT